MKTTFDRKQLSAIWKAVAHAAPTKSPKPVLSNVLCRSTDTEVALLATDMECGVRYIVPDAVVDRPGEALLPLGIFGQILSESSDETLVVTLTKNALVVAGQRSEFKLPVEPAADFPAMPQPDGAAGVNLAVGDFIRLVNSIGFAADVESTRYAMAGIRLEFGASDLTGVACDGRRLAKLAIPSSDGSNVQACILPIKAARLIARSLTGCENYPPAAELTIAVTANNFFARNSQVSFSARLLEGRYPRWRDVIPSNKDYSHIEMKAGDLNAGLRQAAIVATKPSPGVDFEFTDSLLSLTAATADSGQSRVELPTGYSGSPVKLCLSHRYVADFLKSGEPDDVVSLDVKDNQHSAVLTARDVTYVVMPLGQ